MSLRCLLPGGQMLFGQMLFGQVLFGQVLFGQMLFGRMLFGQRVTCQMTNQTPRRELPFLAIMSQF